MPGGAARGAPRRLAIIVAGGSFNNLVQVATLIRTAAGAGSVVRVLFRDAAVLSLRRDRIDGLAFSPEFADREAATLALLAAADFEDLARLHPRRQGARRRRQAVRLHVVAVLLRHAARRADRRHRRPARAQRVPQRGRGHGRHGADVHRMLDCGMRHAIAVEGLTKRFGEAVVVRDVSFAVAPGEIVGLLGPNGAGKTTTIQMLLGIIRPTAGRIEILGLDLARERTRVLQQVNFSSAYVALPPRLHGVGESAGLRPSLPHHRTCAVGSTSCWPTSTRRTSATAPVATLSSGQIGAREPVQGAAEPSPPAAAGRADGEPRSRRRRPRAHRLSSDLREHHGITMLYTSHNMAEVEEVCATACFHPRGHGAGGGLAAGGDRQVLGSGVEEAPAGGGIHQGRARGRGGRTGGPASGEG